MTMNQNISPPSDTILDILEERGIALADLPLLLDMSIEQTIALIKNEIPYTPVIANKLSEILGSTPGFWLRRYNYWLVKNDF